MSTRAHIEARLNQLAGSEDGSPSRGTCMITLMVPASCRDLNQYSSLITRELTTAGNVRDKANRRSILTALHSLQIELQKHRGVVPANGLALFAHGEACV